jgi:hypothetical protein
MYSTRILYLLTTEAIYFLLLQIFLLSPSQGLRGVSHLSADL